MVETYISVPIEVQAMQFNANNVTELVEFTKCTAFQLVIKNNVYNCTITVNGVKLLVLETNFVIKNTDGSIQILSQEIFNNKYIKKE